jgi:hypothetical protein
VSDSGSQNRSALDRRAILLLSTSAAGPSTSITGSGGDDLFCDSTSLIVARSRRPLLDEHRSRGMPGSRRMPIH